MDSTRLQGTPQPEAAARLAAANMIPVQFEIDSFDLQVKGEIPRGISGTLLRNGPNRQFLGEGQNHWFTGDGMLHRFEFDEGKLRYCNRWIRTQRFLEERAAGRSTRSSSVTGVERPDMADSSANTNIVWHGDRLLALEESHFPYEIDPGSLATLGVNSLGNVLTGPFTAHPHIDPVNGEMVFFGCRHDGAFGKKMSYGRIDANGRVAQYEVFDAPIAAFVHDFIVTRDHVVFPLQPLTMSAKRAAEGRPALAWEPEAGAFLGVMPRAGTVKELRWIPVEASYVYHFMNAWDDAGSIHADAMEFAQPSLFPNADGSAVDPLRQRAKLTRWTIDPIAGSFKAEQIDDLSGEFPRVDDRFAMQACRHGWYSCSAPGRSGGLDAISHIDHATGRRSTFALPVGDVPSEPVFVPASATAEEGDGWILSVAWRAPTEHSELLVLNARDVEAGPVATVPLPQRVPFGFHGNFRTSSN